MEQKKTIALTASINEKEINHVRDFVKKGYKTIFLGCGTASHCALAGKYFFAKAGIETQAYGSYEFQPFIRTINNKTLIIAISQSGETADTLIAAKAAKKNGAKIVAVVNARGSTLERLADIVLPVGAGPEIAVVSTKAFTSQLAILYLLSKSIENHYHEGIIRIKNLKKSFSYWLNKKLTQKLINLAKSLISEEHIYLIGKHLNYPAALEFALKLKESSYLHAEAFAAGELKHGVIALIQKGTPCFVLVSEDDVKKEVLSSAAELKARDGKIIGIAPFNSQEFDENIQTPNLGDLTIFGNIIVGQLLGYYLSVGRGADPDKPRNLAKSVTVK
jgi:glucosamine--fructose-6-phosphate aminotransferase (isomerizing)